MTQRSPGRNAAFLAVAVLCACAPSANDTTSNAAVYDAWQMHRSYVQVTANGSVARVLGTRVGPSGAHEGFLLHLRGSEGRGLTVRVEDNVDITGQIPLQPGDEAVVRGEYIYDPRGGIIHYTHRDPRGRHPSGYVRVNGRIYSLFAPPARA